MTAKPEQGLDENYLQAAVAVVGSARTDKPMVSSDYFVWLK